ncbi:unnamed protein product [Microthlaspi erraticum]|uniref:Retroviral polymerase SH3-like domain-containing protein n=1 Tax=Microthlaspi erraticum TaxID=1685480 RepID=A0A6D2K1H5_9BRAS|nr:unnamed protein product [Microthlaspi erraticum]
MMVSLRESTAYRGNRSHAGMPKTYWSYAFPSATYLINRQSTSILNMESPFQRLFGVSPNYSKLRIYGCLCFPWLRSYTQHKLEDRSTLCIFIGYSQIQSAYLCLQPVTIQSLPSPSPSPPVKFLPSPTPPTPSPQEHTLLPDLSKS